MELLKSIEIVLGLIFAGGGAILTGAVWLDRRSRTYAASTRKEVRGGQTQTHARLDRLEQRVGAIEGEVDDTRERLGGIEARLEGLATKDQSAQLGERLGRVEGALVKVGTQLDTLYRAALRAGGGDDG
jgi:tetrahydromethanopterin S-methyltransferase subunit G